MGNYVITSAQAQQKVAQHHQAVFPAAGVATVADQSPCMGYQHGLRQPVMSEGRQRKCFSTCECSHPPLFAVRSGVD